MKKFLIAVVAFSAFAAVAYAAIVFPDVDGGAWYYDGVQYVAENEIMNGYQDGTFGPNDAVTRAQLATVMMRLDAAKIESMLVEIDAVRTHEAAQLSGSDWATYQDQMTRFPVEGIQPLDGTASYNEVESSLDVVASDGTYELLATSEDADFFFISDGDNVYGPFFDDISTLASQL